LQQVVTLGLVSQSCCVIGVLTQFAFSDPLNMNPKLTQSSKHGRRKMSQEVTAAFTEKFPCVQPPTQQAIHKLNARYEETGSGADLPGHDQLS
jgi:hypothetical protein